MWLGIKLSINALVTTSVDVSLNANVLLYLAQRFVVGWFACLLLLLQIFRTDRYILIQTFKLK
jgi:hypothetical protein